MSAVMADRGRKLRQVPTPQETDALIDELRGAAAGLDATTSRLVHLLDAVLPEILPTLDAEGDTADGTGRRVDEGGAGAAGADRPGRPPVPERSDRRPRQ